MQELEAFALALVGVGVGIVACQRVIHPYLRRRLAENGVLSLERLSALNIASFQSVKYVLFFSIAKGGWDTPPLPFCTM